MMTGVESDDDSSGIDIGADMSSEDSESDTNDETPRAGSSSRGGGSSSQKSEAKVSTYRGE